MTIDHDRPPSDPNDMSKALGANTSNVNLIYILYLIGLAVGLTALIGLIMAYINQGKAEPWLQSHYTFLIRTFWIGLLFFVISFVATVVLIGFLMLVVVMVWFIVRMIKGMQALNDRQPIADPTRWGF